MALGHARDSRHGALRELGYLQRRGEVEERLSAEERRGEVDERLSAEERRG